MAVSRVDYETPVWFGHWMIWTTGYDVLPYQYQHAEFTGDTDPRCGTGRTLQECIDDIRDYMEENDAHYD